MNLNGKLIMNQTLSGTQAIAGGTGGSGASTWNEISGKPFNTLGEDFTVTGGELGINSSSLLDGYATEQYVDDAIADIPATDWDDITNKPSFATVATTGDYDDLLNKPTIPIVPTDVSAFNNDAGYITDSALSGYATETYVNSATATVYDSITTTLGDYATKNYAEGLTTGLASESYVDTAISNIPDPDWSDVQNKPTFATVATSGDYDDLDNKPTIPQADGTTIIDNNGVFSAVGSGVDIDNKSIIKNADDELQEAVPIYTKVISHDVGGVGLNISNYRAGTPDGDFYIDTNETQLTFVSGASSDNKYYNIVLFGNNGWVSAKWKNTTSVTFNSIIDNASSYFASKIGSSIQCFYRYQQDSTLFPNGNHYGVKFHIYDTSVLPPWSQWTGFLIYPTEDGIAAGDTLETQCETLGLTWAQGVWNEQIIHKLPNEYLNLKSDELLNSGYYPMLYNDASGIIRAKRLGAGSNMSLGTINLADGTQGYQISCTLKESPVGGYVSGEGGSSSLYLSNFEDISGGNPFKRRYYTSQSNWNSFFANAGNNKDLTFSLRYCMSGTYYNAGPKITGVIHLGASNTDQPVIEGFEEIIDSYYIDTTSTNKYFCIELKDGYNIGYQQNIMMLRPVNYYPIKQNINSFFLPLDNSTIVRDSNGNIKTAIPAPPTTDGTYTLQVVITNGEPAYSWV